MANRLIDASKELAEAAVKVEEAANKLVIALEAAQTNGSLSATFGGAIISPAYMFAEVQLGTSGTIYSDGDDLVDAAREVLELIERLTSEPVAAA